MMSNSATTGGMWVSSSGVRQFAFSYLQEAGRSSLLAPMGDDLFRDRRGCKIHLGRRGRMTLGIRQLLLRERSHGWRMSSL